MKGDRRNNPLIRHVKEHALMYFVITVVFFTGVFAGSYVVKNLNSQQEIELLNYLDMFLTGLRDLDLQPSLIVQHAVLNNLKVILCIWFLGLTVIGVPLVLLIIWARGFVLGFTIGFLVQQKAIQGILISVLAVFPPSIITLPAMIVGAAFAISFSSLLVKGRSKFENSSLLGQFVAYCTIMLLVMLVSAAGGLVEAYVSPTFIKLITDFSVAAMAK